MTLGERLRTARNGKGFTQQYMADQLGIAKSTYNGWESNFRKPNVLMVQKLALILGVSGSYLVGSDGVNDQSQSSDILYISRPTGNPSTDELRKHLHDIIDQMDEEDLKLFSDITIRMRRE